MPRFYIPPARWNPENLVLDDGETHHALDVLRLGAGERAVAFNGRGESAEVGLARAGRRAVALRAVALRRSPPPACRITLAQAVPKGKNMELIVQKAAELGAAAIVPLLTGRTVVRLDAREAEKKRGKWQAVAVEACKQCGQDWLPQVAAPQGLGAFLGAGHGEAPPFDLLLVASLQPGARHLKAALAEGRERAAGAPRSVAVLIGPEGDFSPEELEAARTAGCLPVSLGPIVLRTETAALWCLSVLGYELGQPAPPPFAP